MGFDCLNAENELKAIEKRLVEIIVNLGYFKGRSKRTSEILAYLYIYNRATQKMLREATGYSLGTVSNALKDLQQLGLLRKSRDPDGREYLYELVIPMSKQLTHYSAAMDQYFREWNVFLEQLESRLRKKNIAERKGVGKIRHFISKMRVVIPTAADAMRRLQLATSETQEEFAEK
ncbi:MAG: MarR family transcriptional regulator [Candidatus Bathyarchaeota archaeon]|jgi:DNA-binding transcriptional regulator GbsR (MarR family)|nr:MAG: MarR family transcriptional regulator [Candidatus Bathyarchaeota archaeon]